MKAFVVSEIDGKLECGVRDVVPSSTNDDDILVRVEYSGVNFKDAMVASAPSSVRRLDSLVGGVDAAGVIEESRHGIIVPGTRVAVHGGNLGVGRNGGFASKVYAPSRYLSVLPSTISTHDAMVIGTAGFTSMASVLALEDRGLAAGAQILVTGATGGVGSQAVTYLSLRGFSPVASTGSPAESQWLLNRGAARVIGRSDVSDRIGRVMGSELWDGAIDCVGGETLQQILRSLRYGAAVAASGLVGSADLSTSLFPFITRGVALLGIDAVEATAATRERVWSALGEVATRIDFSALLDRVISLEEIPGALDDVRRGATRGRVVVQLND
ncbi:MAG TPA: acryloyl-CoA reductase [Acidimicrobiales bacterium]|nr:acryloyl-CoA reductase [Acidimicrobiales bacterium]